MNTDILSVKEAASEIGLTDHAIHQYIRSGRLSAKRLGLRVYIIQRIDLERFKSDRETDQGQRNSKD
jgi:excisionase family DNA binding protein